jgi:2-oxoglutarate ferredoxin oxidoreductase subunit alpha
VVVVEMNLGQYVHEIRRVLAGRQVDFYGQMDGRLITPAKLQEVIDGK